MILPNHIHPLFLSYLPSPQLIQMQRHSTWGVMARNILDDRVRGIIEKWQRVASSENREERVAILKHIFVESDELLELDEARQDRVFSAITPPFEEISEVHRKHFAGEGVDPAVYSPLHRRIRLLPDFYWKDSALSHKGDLLRVLAWKMYLSGKNQFINRGGNFYSLEPIEKKWMIRGAQLAQLPLLHFQDDRLSAEELKFLKKSGIRCSFKNVHSYEAIDLGIVLMLIAIGGATLASLVWNSEDGIGIFTMAFLGCMMGGAAGMIAAITRIEWKSKKLERTSAMQIQN